MLVRLRITFPELHWIPRLVVVVSCSETEELEFVGRERQHVDLRTKETRIRSEPADEGLGKSGTYDRQRIEREVTVRECGKAEEC